MTHLQNFCEGYIISLWLDLNKVKCSVGGDGVYCSDNFMQILKERGRSFIDEIVTRRVSSSFSQSSSILGFLKSFAIPWE